MSYFFSKKLETSFDDAINITIKALSDNGFGVISDIDISATLKKKIDVDFRK